MKRHLIACPYCHGACPADARFCIECSAALQQPATHTTHRLVAVPDPSAKELLRSARVIFTSERIRLSFIDTVLGAVLVPLAVLANRDPQFDSIAALLLAIGVVQFVRCTMRGQIIAGLRAAVIGVALVLAMITPWILTLSIAADALLVVLVSGRYASHTELSPSVRECSTGMPTNAPPGT